MTGHTKWTEAEDAALRRNYPLYGTDMTKWDEPIERTHSAIWQHAKMHGIVTTHFMCHTLDRREQMALAAILRRACDALGCTTDELVQETVVLAREGEI